MNSYKAGVVGLAVLLSHGLAGPVAQAGALVQTTVVETAYDDFGNVVRQEETRTVEEPGGPAVYTITSLSAYDGQSVLDFDEWHTGRLVCSLQARQRPADASLIASDLLKVRSRAYQYVDDPSRPYLSEQIQYEYDGALVVSLLPETCEAPDAAWRIATEYDYDVAGNQTSATVSGSGIESRETTIAYDTANLWPVMRTNALGQSEVTTYHAGSMLPATVTDPSGLVTEYTYDAFGRVTKEKRPDGTQTITTRDICSAPLGCSTNEVLRISTQEQRSSNSSAITQPAYAYLDMYGRELRSVTETYGTAFKAFQRKTYDARGAQITDCRPVYENSLANEKCTQFSYDRLGRLASTISPDGGVTGIEYVSSFETETINAKGQSRIERRNGAGDIIGIVDAASNALAHVHDAAGNLRKTFDPAGNTIEVRYDPLGRKVWMNDPDRGLETSGYDVLGNLLTSTDAKSQTITFTYDKLDRVTRRQEADMDSYWEYRDTVPAIGKLKRAYTRLPNGDVDYERTPGYDSVSRVTSVTTTKRVDPNLGSGDPDFVYTFTYDSASRLETYTYPTGVGYKNVYDTKSFLKQVVEKDSGLPFWEALTRDAAGRVTRERLGNGLVTDRLYDAETDRIESILTGMLSGGSLTASVQNDSFAFDEIGNLTLRNSYWSGGGITEFFEYDTLNRLTKTSMVGGGVQTAAYDALGNITSRSDVGTYSYTGCGGPHRVCSITGTLNTSYTYDNNGNTLTGNGRTMTWTSFDQPATIARGTVTETFLYTPDRERLRRTSNDNGDITTTIYLNPRIDLGGTYEKVYKPGGAIEHVHHIYAGSIVIGSVVTTGASGAPPASAPAWSTDLSTAPTTANPNATGLTMPASGTDPHALVQYDNSGDRLDVESWRPFYGPTSSAPSVKGQRAYAGAAVVFRAEVTTGSNNTNLPDSPGRYFRIGVENGGSFASGTATARVHQAYLRGSSLYAYVVDGTNVDGSGNLVPAIVSLGMNINNNTAYAVEIETAPSGSTLYVYPLSGTRASGVSHAIATAWDQPGTGRRLSIDTIGAQSEAVVSNHVYIDNLSEVPGAPLDVRYFHKDHLDSITAVTNTAGEVIQRFKYDAWGRRATLAVDDPGQSVSLWSSDLASEPGTSDPNATGLTMPSAAQDPDDLVQWDAGGKLAFRSSATEISSPVVRGQTKVPAAALLRIRGEVTPATTGDQRNRRLFFAMENTGTGGEYRRYGAMVRGASIFAQTCNLETSRCDEVRLGAVAGGTTYIVEVESLPVGNTLRVYNSATPTVPLYTHTAQVDWTGGGNPAMEKRLAAGTGRIGPNALPVPAVLVWPRGNATVYLDNLSMHTLTPTVATTGVATRRGYTLHEHMDPVELIHMNGRLYDAMTGRFVSADLLIDGEYDLQGYNRYSYVKNNPLSLSDPGGYETLVLAPISVTAPRIDALDYQMQMNLNAAMNMPYVVGGMPDNLSESIPQLAANDTGGRSPEQLIDDLVEHKRNIGKNFNKEIKDAGRLGVRTAAQMAGPGFFARVLGRLKEIFGLAKAAALERTALLNGLPGRDGKTGPIKMVKDQQELEALFAKLSSGGKQVDAGNYPGVVVEHVDGMIVRMRPGSRSGGATLDITMPDKTIVKVHISSP